MSFFEVSTPSGHVIGSAESLADVASVLRLEKPGRYRVLAVSLTPFSSGRWLNPWGTATRGDDGTVTLEPTLV
jgi:hypothetical protein